LLSLCEDGAVRAPAADVQRAHPLLELAREDLDLVTELALRSGSLKDVAAAYGVSYPTIRLRIDKLVERLRAILAGRPRDPLAELLAELVERAEITPAAAKVVLAKTRELQRGGASRPEPSRESARAPSPLDSTHRQPNHPERP
jgi:hypothetical protein